MALDNTPNKERNPAIAKLINAADKCGIKFSMVKVRIQFSVDYGDCQTYIFDEYTIRGSWVTPNT